MPRRFNFASDPLAVEYALQSVRTALRGAPGDGTVVTPLPPLPEFSERSEARPVESGDGYTARGSDVVDSIDLEALPSAGLEVVFEALDAVRDVQGGLLPGEGGHVQAVNRQRIASAVVGYLAPMADPQADERVSMSVAPGEHELRWDTVCDEPRVLVASMHATVSDPLGVNIQVEHGTTRRLSGRRELGYVTVRVGDRAMTPVEAMFAAKAMLVAAFEALAIEREDLEAWDEGQA